jgi:hypothetical protein
MMGPERTSTVWEPACNRGYLAKGLRPYFAHVFESDIHDYGRNHTIRDFLFGGIYPISDWIVTNPPFRLGEQFALTALDRATRGVALLVRTQFLEGVGRYKNLFNVKPPFMVAQFVERLPMVKGRIDPLASTATSYCWIVWLKNTGSPTHFTWIPPCRKRLEQAGDYA